VRPALVWCVPDLALVTATVTLFYCLFLFQGYRKLFRDSDAGWHIRTGEAILTTGTLPHTDTYSFSKPGQPWFAWEWGADVIVGAIHRASGLQGVALFYGTLIAAGVWLWFRLHWLVGGDFLVACGMAPLLLSTCEIHWLARPHVIAWLLLLGSLCYLERSMSRPLGWTSYLMAAVYMVLWANLHASFFLGAALATIYALGLWWSGTADWFPMLKLAAVAAIAPIANPYGWQLYAHVYRYLTDGALIGRIAEFQSYDFHAAGSGQIIATVMLGIAGGALALTKKRYVHFLLAMAISVMALRSARALPIAALILLPLANGAIAATIDLPWRDYANRLRALDAQFLGLALAPVILFAALLLLRIVPTGFPPDDFPVAAYEHIPESARLFASDKFGGYLIYRSAGTRKVFFDGRSDFYGIEFLNQYGRIVQVRPGWQALWKPYGFTHALLPAEMALTAVLEQQGWRRVYQDKVAVLLER